MTNRHEGQFSIGQLPDGRFVAAALCEPYFCFRAATEDDVLVKVKDALSFYAESRGGRGHVSATPLSQTVTALRPQRRESVSRILEAA